MKIPILHSLETREQWQQFSRRKIAYAYVERPSTLVDFQSNYLLLTRIDKDLHDGRKAIKFSLGSKHSNKPCWQLIQRCKWSLNTVLSGLNSLNFNTNVRDNCALNIQGETTVRKFFSKEKSIISPNLLKPLGLLQSVPKHLEIGDIKNILCFGQYQDLEIKRNSFQFNSVKAILLQLISHPDSWHIEAFDHQVTLSFHSETILYFTAHIKTVLAPAKSDSKRIIVKR